MIRHHDLPPLPACRSRPVERRAPCVLDRGDGPDQILGSLLQAYPTLTIGKAIAMLCEAGW